jgi:hypothetical protein
MSLIRGVLLAGKFRNHHELNVMSRDDQRNTLIVEMVKHSSQSGSSYQALNDDTLAGAGAVMVFLREGGIRDDAALKTMSADGQRNTLIVEIDGQTHLGSRLQGLSNMDLVLVGLGKEAQPGVALTADRISFIRGVLLIGKFRNHHQLNAMSHDDQRNTLIVELAGHSNQSISSYQALDDDALAGAGAVMVFLRKAGIRDDAALKTMSADDQRNTLIVEIDGQTHLGSRLQGVSNLDLVLLGLGADVFVPNELHGTSRTRDGVFGESEHGVGVHGKGRRLAGFFEGDVEVTGDIRLTNADCAEDFEVSGAAKLEPGTVMVLTNEGTLSASRHAYDKRVAGVISGAGDYKPGIVLDTQQTSGNRQPIALLGKVFCKVDARYGAIEVGDLLTTSSTTGHAMKSSDSSKAFGAVIGKALRPLDAGRGLIPILIALQ